jgi:hypothetical protein
MNWTIEQWVQYINTLEGEELLSKAAAVNSMRFVSTLQDRGLNAEEIAQFYSEFAMRFAATGQSPPNVGLYDYARLIRES